MIRRSDRLFLCGPTGSGKSYLARRFFEACAPPRLVIDPKNDPDATGGVFADGRSAVPFSDPNRLPSVEVARFVPRDPGDLDAYDRLYTGAFAVPDLVVWCDEAAVVAPSNRITSGVRTFVMQGRVRGQGHIVTNQQPTWVDRTLLANSEHLIAFQTFLPDHTRALAEAMGRDRDALTQWWGQLPHHGFVWYAARDQLITLCDPI